MLCVSFILFIANTVMSGILFFAEIKKLNGTNTEAFLVSIINGLWLIYAVAHILYLVSIFSAIGFIMQKRYLMLSKEIMEINVKEVFLQNILQEMLENQVELWGYWRMINEQWDVFMPLFYTCYLYATSFLWYATLFVKINATIKIIWTTASLLSLFGLIAFCWAFSNLTSVMYDNFISIEKVSSANLPLTFKFKINDFMKRFGKIPLGISMGGFFHIKRDFLIRVISAVYSTFSSCVEVSGILEKESKCMVKQGNNTLRV
ncbi:uncharacterized protein LOC111625767 [Centruroides sculpturatus]|uniref:uncharacterized protein LOC111625767 n=1 Tax=Centruroides sculpturatus TaxID=218467 RepID=UPI000C6D487F|nr:uncharacterized protein LOC111625767 [Centruroides sculpturatus]